LSYAAKPAFIAALQHILSGNKTAFIRGVCKEPDCLYVGQKGGSVKRY